ncbi:MAG: tRNA (adenosine(37)-N6)-threonylcarbamoyltransferase complex dimerization subunit type 1 TsaB [Treponema sp.]|nr:tRNA (adenosine(37)-N6)-threonylcarbamoyltransferase complex dimerization subunit type 1 TsaB [Treponema sp.]
MNILALDTATTILSVALATERENFFFEVDAGRRHSELLMEVTERVIKTAGLEPRDIELVACMRGPGSFTGLRIGFAAAKGLSLSLGIPLVAIPTLDCMAAPCRTWPGIVLPVIDAKKHRYFTALYRSAENISPYMDADAEAIAQAITEADQDELILLTGPDADMLLQDLEQICSRSVCPTYMIRLDPSRKKGRGSELLEIARRCSIVHHRHDVYSGPEYLRKSDAELNSLAKHRK